MSYIAGINMNGNNNLIGSTLYGTCNTAADVAGKVVLLNDFDRLVTGVTIHVEFNESNTAENPTLNVNSTGAVNIGGSTTWAPKSVVSFTYNGNSWMMNDVSAASLSSGDVVSSTEFSQGVSQILEAISSGSGGAGEYVDGEEMTF